MRFQQVLCADPDVDKAYKEDPMVLAKGSALFLTTMLAGVSGISASFLRSGVLMVAAGRRPRRKSSPNLPQDTSGKIYSYHHLSLDTHKTL